jgi:hypothetical protein
MHFRPVRRLASHWVQFSKLAALPNTEKNGGRNISELTLEFQVYILLLNEQNQQRGGRGGREGAQNKHRKERDF